MIQLIFVSTRQFNVGNIKTNACTFLHFGLRSPEVTGKAGDPPHYTRRNHAYPTLGCPALLGPDQQLEVLMSLPAGTDPTGVGFRLVDRHRQQGAAFGLQGEGAPELVKDSPTGDRKLFRFRFRMDAVPFTLFDLHAASGAVEETQYNAVRRYQAITGSEQVIFCGDSQYNVDNQICLQRFIERVNPLMWRGLLSSATFATTGLRARRTS